MILMASRGARARRRASADDYRAVYGALLAQARAPVILHWLGDMFDPPLAGYWGGDDLDAAARRGRSTSSRPTPTRSTGSRSRCWTPTREVALRERLPDGVRMYTGDDFNYPELIRGDGRQPRAARHLRRDRAGRRGRDARARRRRPRPLRRRCSRRPSRSRATSSPRPRPYYKTGVVFLAFLNGHQQHFRMVGGLESGALGAAPGRAVRARRPGRAAARPRARERAHAARARAGGRRCEPGCSFNSMTADRWPLAEVIDACAEHGVEWIGPWRHKVAEIGVEEARAADRRRRPEGLEPVPRRLLRRRDGRATTTTGARSRRPRRSAPTRSCSSAGRRSARTSAAARDMIEARHRAAARRTRSSTASGSASSRCTR